MSLFAVERSKCIKCGACVADCLPKIIKEDSESVPFVPSENESKCMGCQHCLTICPTGAVSVMGFSAADCVPASAMATAEATDALIRNRRSVRKFKQKQIDQGKMDRILMAAANAPTGKNTREVMITCIDNQEAMNRIKERWISAVEKKIADGTLPEKYANFKDKIPVYRKGKDIIFRGAPNMLIASCPKKISTALADAYIALTYAELMAYTIEVGTCWAGNAMFILDICPELATELGIPEDHVISYVLYLGEAAVKYYRGSRRDEVKVNRVM